jgi:polyisoprenoid-binding protein YceI
VHELVRYRIERGRVVVMARSSIHDTRTVWSALGGSAEADPAELTASARLEVEVDMTSFDAGDFLKNRKLRKDLELERHPTARFTLTGLEAVAAAADGFTATARGTLAWRGRSLELAAAGRGRIDRAGFTATARFELDVTRLGVTPPRFFVFKVEDVVAVEIELSGRAG